MSDSSFGGSGAQGRAKLVLLRGGGGDGAEYTLSASEHRAGREHGLILFPDDPTVSPSHAEFFYQEGQLMVRDLGSANGTYVRIRTPVELGGSDRFVCGEQMFELRTVAEAPNPWVDDVCFTGSVVPEDLDFQLIQVLAGDRPGMVRGYGPTRVTIGREGCTLSFSSDRYMSHEHASVGRSGSTWTIEDSGSKNGTYVRIRADVPLQDGDTLFIGKQLVRVDIAS